MLEKSTIKSWLVSLGFKIKDGFTDIWMKEYKQNLDYIININLESDNLTECKIHYGQKIVIGRGTILNFSQSENLVVLECVNRLLEKGYKPESIHLEKDWKLGHKEKGSLDILVKSKEHEDSFLMIECKTWGTDYEKAKNKMLRNGGQLFSYFIQEPKTNYLCLYSSKLSNGTIDYINDIVEIKDDFRNKNLRETFKIWDKLFERRGIFESEILPYNIKFEGIKYVDLKDIKAEDGGRIFNQFAEILRRNVVSDKTNAFNKIFNLFLCKIQDEDSKSGNDVMDFQWRNGETNKDVLMRLSDLYKKGMNNYLNLSISDLTHKEIEDKLVSIGDTSGKRIEEIVEEIYTILRLYKNNEFAFKEVFDEKTFNENCIVVKDVIKILEKYRIKYTTKQQFLGDFFEKLLNTGIKQEVGQFFTPIPITRFICCSIPIKDIIEKKIKEKESEFLPYVIDFASGSGHFITEALAQINKHLYDIDDCSLIPIMKNNLDRYKISYNWANTFIYGIEKDYRLAKTTKVSCFLNGDGEAKIICGDGLDNFYYSKEFIGLLKTDKETKDNQKFDILIANPPYSVSGFKNISKNLDKSFDLYNRLTDESSEIECLFLERAKQLLKEGGFAGIFFPISLLTNSVGIYEEARKVLLKYFDIISIVEFGSRTFMATGTKTVALFLKRRDNLLWEKINNVIESFFKNKKDIACNGIPNAFSKYVSISNGEISFTDYIDFINCTPNETVKKSELFKDYQKWFHNLSEVKKIKEKRAFRELPPNEQDKMIEELFYSKVFAIEKEKLLYFILTYNKKVVMVRAGSKNIEKQFLGYKFSNRRGHEGIKLLRNTKLYNELNLFDKTKVNYYIYKNFRGEEIAEIDESLKNHIRIHNLNDSIDFTKTNFDKTISTRVVKKSDIEVETKFEKKRLCDFVGLNFKQGLIYDSEDEEYSETRNKILTASNIKLDNGQLEFDDIKYLRDNLIIENDYKLRKNDIFICTSSGSIEHLGKNTYISKNMDYYFGGFCGVIRTDNPNLSKYIYQLLNTDKFKNYVDLLIGQNINNLSSEDLLNYKIPYPSNDGKKLDLRIIERIVKKLQQFENSENTSNSLISKNTQKINSIILGLSSRQKQIRLGDVITLEYGKSLPEDKRDVGEYPVVGSNGIVGYHNSYLLESPVIIVGRKGSVGQVALIEKHCTPIDTTFYVKFDKSKQNYKYIYYILKALKLDELGGGLGSGGINRNKIYAIKIPDISKKIQDDVINKILPLEKQIIKSNKSLSQIRDKKNEILFKELGVKVNND